MNICPFCNEEMKKGFIPTDTIIPQWIPEGKKLNSIRFFKSKDGVELGGEKSSFGHKSTAYLCEKCGSVILKTRDRKE